MGYPSSVFTVDRVLTGEEIDLGGVSYKVNGGILVGVGL